MQMPYTVQDYLREVTLEHLDTLTPEERMKGIAIEEALKFFFPKNELEEIKQYLLQKAQKENQKK